MKPLKHINLFRSWGRILTGYYPTLSLEITRECPLRCPGCYAYETEHLKEAGPLRSLADYHGQALIDGVLALVRRLRPVYLSVVGGEPLVRFRELDVLVPQLSKMGVTVQMVTSAVRPIPTAWRGIKGLWIVVSIDGLQPEHDKRRAPATYARILKNIQGHLLNVHCTVTRQMLQPGAFREFLTFWSGKPEIRQIWFSLFTPQIGNQPAELLSRDERTEVLKELATLRSEFPKMNLPDSVLQGYLKPPASPADCLFARTTLCVTADLRSKITPCQFGGNPDCSQCGCMASAGLSHVGDYRILGVLPVRSLYEASYRIGKASRGTARDLDPLLPHKELPRREASS
ncbi:MAG: radical SAM protein [Acidobacteria bacterium]|nr:radical SAM protein [Acidobacteriota bacterium]